MLRISFDILPVLLGAIAGFLMPQLFDPDTYMVSNSNNHLSPDAVIAEAEKLSDPIDVNEGIKDNRKTIPSGKTIAQQLYDDVRIACLVLTKSDRYDTQAKQIRETWGKRCNKITFFDWEGSRKNDTFGVVEVPVLDGYLWSKIKEVLLFTYKHISSDADWFFLSPDST